MSHAKHQNQLIHGCGDAPQNYNRASDRKPAPSNRGRRQKLPSPAASKPRHRFNQAEGDLAGRADGWHAGVRAPDVLDAEQWNCELALRGVCLHEQVHLAAKEFSILKVTD